MTLGVVTKYSEQTFRQGFTQILFEDLLNCTQHENYILTFTNKTFAPIYNNKI